MAPEDHNEYIVRTVNTPHQFSYESGIRVLEVEAGYAKGVLEVGPNSINPHGNVHGGALATLADTVGGCCACSEGGSCVTANCSMEFLRPASARAFIVRPRPRSWGVLCRSSRW